jgi:diphthine synthase
MLYLISLGLEKGDISIKSLETAKKCQKLYLETYTSLGASLSQLKTLFGREIIPANRSIVESDSLIKEAKNQDIALLIHGDALSATTHLSLIQEARKNNIPYKIFHSSSILTAVAETGLSLYKFGATASIPFQNNIKSPYQILKQNDSINLHTLFLLDLNPETNAYLNITDAANYLIKNGMPKTRLCIACSGLGTENQKIFASSAENLPNLPPPCCFIVPGKLNFFEEEFLGAFRKKNNEKGKGNTNAGKGKRSN